MPYVFAGGKAIFRTRLNPLRNYLIAIIAASWLTGCPGPNRIISRPSIIPGKDWRFEEHIPYVYGGVSKGDHLIGQGLAVRIEALNASRIPQLVIRLEFLGADRVPVDFIPSAVVVQLGTGQGIRATGYECKGALLESPVYRSSVKPIRETAFSQRYNCIDLYFDVPPPSIEDLFTMRVDGVRVQGNEVKVPDITFRKGIARW